MESLKVTDLRTLAREAMLSCGARGFMRFAKDGDALLLCDAAARCADGGAALTAALAAAGFVCRTEGALLLLTPGEALLARLCMGTEALRIDWGSPLHPAQAFAARLMRADDMPLTDAGRAFVLETARLLWQPQSSVLLGLGKLRAMAAERLREGRTNGFYQAGRLLANWCQEQKEEEDAR